LHFEISTTLQRKRRNILYDRGGHLDELCEVAMWEGFRSTVMLNIKTKEVFFSYWLLISVQPITVGKFQLVMTFPSLVNLLK
jgi:hypothetical protein